MGVIQQVGFGDGPTGGLVQQMIDSAFYFILCGPLRSFWLLSSTAAAGVLLWLLWKEKQKNRMSP